MCGGSCAAAMGTALGYYTGLLNGIPENEVNLLAAATESSMPSMGGDLPSLGGDLSSLGGDLISTGGDIASLDLPSGDAPESSTSLLGSMFAMIAAANVSVAGRDELTSAVNALPECVCASTINTNGLVGAFAPMGETSPHITIADVQALVGRALTDSGGCTVDTCKQSMGSFFQAVEKSAQPMPTCSAGVAKSCVRRCGRCQMGDGGVGAALPSSPAVQHDARVTDFTEFATLAGASGLSPRLVRSLQSNVSSDLATFTRLMKWGPERVDADGVPCAAHCATSCGVDTYPMWLPACAATLTCPPAGVAGYKVAFRATLSRTIEQFDAAARAQYKERLASYLKGAGSAVTPDQIELEVSSASIVVVATVSTSSSLDRDIITDAVKNVTSGDAQLYLDSHIEAFDGGAAQAEQVEGEAGTLTAPPAEPDDGTGGGGGGAAMIAAVVVVVFVGFAFCSICCSLRGRQMRITKQFGVQLGNMAGPPPSGNAPPPTANSPNSRVEMSKSVKGELMVRHELTAADQI